MNSTQAGKAADNICTNQNPVLKTHMASLMARKMKSPCSVVFAMNPNPKLAFSFTINVTPIARLVWPKIEKSQKIWKK